MTNTTYLGINVEELYLGAVIGMALLVAIDKTFGSSSSTTEYDPVLDKTGWDYTLTVEEQDRLEDGKPVTIDRYHGGHLQLTGTEVHPVEAD